MIGIRINQNFDRICSRWFGNSSLERDWFHGCYRVKTADEVQDQIDNGMPISFFRLGDDGSFCVPFGNGKSQHSIKFMNIVVDSLQVPMFKEFFGTTYVKLLVTGYSDMKRDRFDSVSDYGVFLPLVNDGHFQGLYTMITDTRRAFDGGGRVGKKNLRFGPFTNVFPPPSLDAISAGMCISIACPVNGGDGLSWYDGTVLCRCDDGSLFSIVWDGKQSCEMSQVTLELSRYGLFQHGGWIIV